MGVWVREDIIYDLYIISFFYLIRAMPERKRAFSYDVFPKPIYCSYDSLLSFNLSGLAVEKVKLVIFFHLHQ